MVDGALHIIDRSSHYYIILFINAYIAVYMTSSLNSEHTKTERVPNQPCSKTVEVTSQSYSVLQLLTCIYPSLVPRPLRRIRLDKRTWYVSSSGFVEGRKVVERN